uniref:Transposase for insertion sequence element n=1 Tax=Magnetococcus massalia (strain MO-1) TaxID=451514 RepID=A0A1S7LJB7_MAGMO|nr:Transposase for insertion sequence element [Candidatus Magnetococcus massalia]
MQCDSCGSRSDRVHDMTERWVRDLPIFDAQTHLLVWRCRIWCDQCGGPKLERLNWLRRNRRLTVRFEESVARLCEFTNVKHVASFYDLHWDTVKEIDKRALTARLGPIDLSGVSILGMDEFAIQKGHRYATVIIEIPRKRVLWLGRGRSRESIRPFFEQLGRQGCKQIQAVAMDMNSAFDEEVKAQCPNAEVVFDLFHVVAKYGREVMDRVRVDEANRLREDKQARKVVKSSRWLLLRNRSNIKREEDHIRLNELLEANQALMTIYLLKDELKQLWSHDSEQKAQEAWDQWYLQAMESDIEPLKLFAKRLKPYLFGILSHCKWPYHTSLLEGINNKIKVIKRRAYGYLDDEYFFLKIRDAFPGVPG